MNGRVQHRLTLHQGHDGARERRPSNGDWTSESGHPHRGRSARIRRMHPPTPATTTTTLRTVLLKSTVGLVENVRGIGAAHGEAAERFSPNFQVCLPYCGLFVWHVGRDDVVGDANQVLFVSGGEAYRLSQP